MYTTTPSMQKVQVHLHHFLIFQNIRILVASEILVCKGKRTWFNNSIFVRNKHKQTECNHGKYFLLRQDWHFFVKLNFIYSLSQDDRTPCGFPGVYTLGKCTSARLFADTPCHVALSICTGVDVQELLDMIIEQERGCKDKTMHIPEVGESFPH